MDDRAIINEIKKIDGILRTRAEDDNLSRYNVGDKVHKKQLEFHKSPKRNRWVFGGNRSGKTECGAVETVWLARGNHPYRQNRPNVSGWVVSVTYEVQRDVAQSKVLKYLRREWIENVIMRSGAKGSPDTGVIDTIIIRNVFGGLSKIGFKSADQGREKFQGAGLDFVWFDEEPPYDIYEECKMRVLDRKGDLFGTMTPLKGLTWVYDEIYLNRRNDEEATYIKMEWADNPFLDAKEVAAVSECMSEESLAIRRYGTFRESEGPVYPEFDPQIHVIEPFEVPFEWQDAISIDPGLRNPLSAHFYCCDGDGNVYVVAEHYARNRDIDYHSEEIKRIADEIGWRRNSFGNLSALIDSSAGQVTLASSKSVAELFSERGIDVNCKVRRELFSGISKVRSYFAARPPKIFIFKNCVNMIKEIKSYRWGNDDCPIKREDHAMDELRYYIMSKSRPPAPIEKPDFLEKNYLKLLRHSKKGG